tara:strand:- start:868 stop:1278 length:411 start_codon:yes stop_codon:yes gene_type:complete
MIEELKNIKSHKKNIKDFGITIGVILGIISLILFLKEIPYYNLFIYISSFFIVFALTIPIFLKPLFIIWMIFSIILGWIMTRLILTFLFYFIMFPIGIFMRLFGQTMLKNKNDATHSYWDQRIESIEKNQDYEKQF